MLDQAPRLRALLGRGAALSIAPRSHSCGALPVVRSCQSCTSSKPESAIGGSKNTGSSYPARSRAARSGSVATRYRFSHAKFDKAFGPTEVLPHREAIRQTVQWFREHPAPK
jgi:hypothetical protein